MMATKCMEDIKKSEKIVHQDIQSLYPAVVGFKNTGPKPEYKLVDR